MLASAALLAALSVTSSARTTITVDPPIPASPRYSQAISFTAHLATEDGTPVAGDDDAVCGTGQPCRLQILIAAQGDTATFLVDPAVAHDGSASIRIPFVDGDLNQNITYAATADGAPYVIAVKFLGTLQGASPTNPDCAAGAADSGATGLCPSESDVDVNLITETTAIAPADGLEGSIALTDCDPTDPNACASTDPTAGGAALACEPTQKKCGLLLSAQVTDPNGDAPEGGTEIDGPSPKNLAGVAVQFAFDANNNGSLDGATEVLGTATTNSAGVASLVFVLDPQFVKAGTYATGIFVEFGGDSHYGLARSSTSLTIHPAGLDVSRTVVVAEPDSIPADGVSKSQLKATLVDQFNNPLDAQSEAHAVVFTTTLGHLENPGVRDELDGAYKTTLDANRIPGTATITVTVDGVKGPTKTVTITGQRGGCQCGSTGDVAPLVGALAALWGLAFVRRRR